MRYLLIDRIDYIKVDDHLRAVKSVALSEDVFFEHFFGNPVFPGALLIESVAQAGTALLEYSSDFKKKALLVMVDQTKFRTLVRPGDQLSIRVKILSAGEDSARLEGEIQVNKNVVMNGIFTFALQEIDKFYPEKIRYMMELVYEMWLENCEIVKPGDENE
jgi:3-hydroxyacyl-[acyl-carrier-protein] dehydratase